jgi:hypothetical protein
MYIKIYPDIHFSKKGTHVAYLSRTELELKFPAMKFDDIVAGTYGLVIVMVALDFLVCGIWF